VRQVYDYLWNKYGERNFNFRILEFCQIRDLDEREQYWIDTLNPECNIIRNIAEWHAYYADDDPNDGYIKTGESFMRPRWHLRVYGSQKNPGK
jgi:hypothetical protein